jgi:CRISPR-associated protein Cmr4
VSQALRFAYKLLFLRALTPLHVGAGRGASIYVDLPLQRDEFGFPTIWSSSLKGALRVNFVESEASSKRIIFGPEPAGASEHSSAASFADARLLLIPARALKGIWTYVTSPHMIEQLATFLEIAGKVGIEVPRVEAGKALVSSDNLLFKDSRVMVNEISLEAKVDAGIAKSLAGVLPSELGDTVRSRGLVVISDDIARTVVNRSVVVQYRVRLKHETKTVDVGPWSEEYLPIETVMVSLIVCKNFITPKIQMQADKVCEELEKGYKGPKVVYVGGKETIGKGLVKLYFM